MPHKFLTLDGCAIHLHYRGPTTLPEAPPDTSRGEVSSGLTIAAATVTQAALSSPGVRPTHTWAEIWLSNDDSRAGDMSLRRDADR